MRRSFLLLILFQIHLLQYGQIIADHTVVDKYDQIPQYYINEVKKMWLSYAGESHSAAIRDGLIALEVNSSTFSVNVLESGTPEGYTTLHLRANRATWGDLSHESGWVYGYGEEDWFTSSTAISRTKAGISYCNSNGLTISALGFGWCYDPSINTGSEFQTYIDATQEYVDYCKENNISTTLLFTTGTVDIYVDGTGYNKHLGYEQIRNYVKENKLVLFDYADILCYDDNGILNQVTWDGHTFPVIAPDNALPEQTGHISNAGALRLAKAMWWLLARIAGWDGGTYVLTGDGTFANPFNGTVNSNISWTTGEFTNDTVFIRGITINPGFTITIGTGVTVLTTGDGYLNVSGTLDIGPGAAFTSRDITNNSTGTIRLNSDTTGIASLLITDGYSLSNSGAFETEIYLTGGTATSGYRWHYISSPVENVPTTVFTTNPSTLNLSQYVENLVISNDNSTGWVAFDGYVYNPVDTNLTYRFDGLVLGKGYNYFCVENAIRTITGSPNYSDVSLLLRCGTGDIDCHGFNLIGNPFSSSIDWDKIYLDLPPEVNDAIYFTTEGRSASYVGGIATGNGSNIIVPLQGFFVKLNQPSESISLTLPESARIHNLLQMRYKGRKEIQEEKSTRSALISFIRINIENQDYGDDAVVRFDSSATEGVDKRFDAYKFNKTSGEVDIWTTTQEVDLSINGLSFPDTTLEISVGFNVKTPGIFKLFSKELNKLDNYSVSLRDLWANTQVDLHQGGFYEFNAPAGTTGDRFMLVVSKKSTGISEVPHVQNPFTIYSSHGVLNIVMHSDKYKNLLASVAVYDLAGRRVFLQHNLEWSGKGDTMQVMLSDTLIGLYIIEVKVADCKFANKVLLRR